MVYTFILKIASKRFFIRVFISLEESKKTPEFNLKSAKNLLIAELNICKINTNKTLRCTGEVGLTTCNLNSYVEEDSICKLTFYGTKFQMQNDQHTL